MKSSTFLHSGYLDLDGWRLSLWFCKGKLRLSALDNFHVLGQDYLVFTGISFSLAFHLLVAAAADALMILNQNVALVQLLSWSCEFEVFNQGI